MCQDYSWWNIVIRSAFYVLVYGKHFFAFWNQNLKGVFSFLESTTEDNEQVDSVAASEVSSWSSQ